MTEEDVVLIGKLGKPRGLQGELLVLPLTDFPERFLKMKEILVSTRNGSWETMAIEASTLRQDAGFQTIPIWFNHHRRIIATAHRDDLDQERRTQQRQNGAHPDLFVGAFHILAFAPME